jgi:hypothetical protein
VLDRERSAIEFIGYQHVGLHTFERQILDVSLVVLAAELSVIRAI